MITKFLVEVKRHSVGIYFADSLSNVHYRAKVDGFDYAYQIIANSISFNKPCDDWFKRGGQHVHHHADNQGHYVKWIPVTDEFIKRAMCEHDRKKFEKWKYLREPKNE